MRVRKFSQPQNPNPTDLRVQRRHKKRAGKVERDTARVFYIRLSQVRLKIQFNSIQAISAISNLLVAYCNCNCNIFNT